MCLCLVQNGLFRGEGVHQRQMALKFREKKDWETWDILGNYSEEPAKPGICPRSPRQTRVNCVFQVLSFPWVIPVQSVVVQGWQPSTEHLETGGPNADLAIQGGREGDSTRLRSSDRDGTRPAVEWKYPVLWGSWVGRRSAR